MPPKGTSEPHRAPTQLEREFLRVATFGHPELERQIESCEITEYDPTGWCYLRVFDGPPSPYDMLDGPELFFGKAENGAIEFDSGPPGGLDVLFIEIILWMDGAGFLYAVEFVSYGDEYVCDLYRVFVEAARAEPQRLRYPEK